MVITIIIVDTEKEMLFILFTCGNQVETDPVKLKRMVTKRKNL